ncbi:hypothetical protein [Bacillus sp. AR18-7]|uniref:hypothetical protein n=1 Tax=Bacillus sp. AR18-7 TaxID=2217821 RepID=UPI0011CC6836|nr:hypothetical protein [Bacillus sp. AR18-7]TXR64504.1 hypothetical protein DN395_11220 [Bacillus sp. AR18-7]
MNKISKIESPALVYRHEEPILSILFMLSRQPHNNESYENLVKKCILTFEVTLPSQSNIKKVKFILLKKIGTQRQILASIEGNEFCQGALSAILNETEGIEVNLALKGMQTNLYLISNVVTNHNYEYEISTSLEALLGRILEGKDPEKFIRHQWPTQS